MKVMPVEWSTLACRLCPFLLALSLLGSGTGCRRGETTGREQAPTDEQVSRSSAQLLVDGLTGRQAVRSGRQAREVVEKVSAERNRDLQETME